MIYYVTYDTSCHVMNQNVTDDMVWFTVWFTMLNKWYVMSLWFTIHVIIYYMIQTDLIIIYDVIHNDLIIVYEIVHNDLIIIYDMIRNNLIIMYNMIYNDLICSEWTQKIIVII